METWKIFKEMKRVIGQPRRNGDYVTVEDGLILHLVSNLGNVKIVHQNAEGYVVSEKPVNQHLKGTPQQYMCIPSGPYTHRLVAEAFLENTNGHRFVRHRDGNVLNNNVENLAWSNKLTIE